MCNYDTSLPRDVVVLVTATGVDVSIVFMESS